METEKVCVNLSASELGTIDVLVAQGLYTSRSDLIRAGVRAITEQHGQAFRRATENATCLGVMLLGKRDLERALRDGKRLKIFVVGILRLDGSISPDLADEAIEQIRLLGSLRAPAGVLTRIEDRIARNLDGGSWL